MFLIFLDSIPNPKEQQIRQLKCVKQVATSVTLSWNEIEGDVSFCGSSEEKPTYSIEWRKVNNTTYTHQRYVLQNNSTKIGRKNMIS